MPSSSSTSSSNNNNNNNNTSSTDGATSSNAPTPLINKDDIASNTATTTTTTSSTTNSTQHHNFLPFHYSSTLLPEPTLHAIHTDPVMIHPLVFCTYLQGYTPSQILALLVSHYSLQQQVPSPSLMQQHHSMQSMHHYSGATAAERGASAMQASSNAASSSYHGSFHNQAAMGGNVTLGASASTASMTTTATSHTHHHQQSMAHHHHSTSTIAPQLGAILLPEITSQCRIIKRLESELEEPRVFLEEDGRWNHSLKTKYVRKFFICHNGVLRELLGKKLTGRERRDLDDISNKIHVPLVPCRRMFDNLRNVLERVRETTRDRDNCGSLIDVIQTEFCLDTQVAKQYATVVFSCHHRFALGSRIAWLKDVSYEDLEFCMDTIQENWTRHLTTDPLHIDLDRNALREIKHYFFANTSRMDRYKKQVLASFRVDSRRAKKLNSHFKGALKNLIMIAGKLIQKKELRDFFIDICEKFGDTLVEQCQLKTEEIFQLCDRIIACFSTATDKKISSDQNLVNSWTYFVIVVRNCLHRIMEKSSWYDSAR